MIGAIIGDIVGSFWEFKAQKDRNTELFLPESTITDDTILSIATANAILENTFYTQNYQIFARTYPSYGYGPAFMEWAQTNSNYLKENNSYGNGAAMRVSPIGWAFHTPQRVMIEAQQSASVTHCHIEGIRGAQATALAVFMARTGCTKEEIKSTIEEWFKYSLDYDLEDLHETYEFDVSCQGTVPVAIACVLQSNSFEEVMRNGLHVGGDTDTLLAIAGSIGEGLFGVPDDMRKKAEAILDKQSPKLLGIVTEFERKYGSGRATETGKASRLKHLFASILKRS